jgi:dTDP-L-rhamnose 4-epimerase
MDVLITGGAGFIGSHLAELLISAGHRVRILDNLDPQVHGPAGAWPVYLPAEVERMRGDVRERAALAQAVQDVQAVFHLAAATGVGQSMVQVGRYFEVNVQATALLMELLVSQPHSVRRVILASSRAVYGEGAYLCPACGAVEAGLRPVEQLACGQWEPVCPACGGALQALPTPESKPARPGSVYAITKLTQEQTCLTLGQAYGLETVALRFFNVYGPRQALSNPYTGILTTFLTRLLNGKAPEVYEDGGMTRDFVYVGDVARACLTALEHPELAGKVLNVGSGQAVSILEAARRLRVITAPQAPAPVVTGFARAGDVRHCTADTRLAAAYGITAQVSLDEGLRRLVADARAGELPPDRSEAARRELEQAGLLHKANGETSAG